MDWSYIKLIQKLEDPFCKQKSALGAILMC